MLGEDGMPDTIKTSHCYETEKFQTIYLLLFVDLITCEQYVE